MPESEIITTHHQYLDRLFKTAVGTSYATPLVAHKAAMMLHAFPRANANLLRALLVSSAEIPEPSLRRLQGADPGAGVNHRTTLQGYIACFSDHRSATNTVLEQNEDEHMFSQNKLLRMGSPSRSNEHPKTTNSRIHSR
jgi:hypothetical protein